MLKKKKKLRRCAFRPKKILFGNLLIKLFHIHYMDKIIDIIQHDTTTNCSSQKLPKVN